MKIFTLSPKSAIQLVVTGIVIGSLLSRDYPQTGYVVSLCCIGFYGILMLRRRVGYWIRFKRCTQEKRWLAISWLCVVYLFVAAWMIGHVYIFFLLIILGVDYFLYDKQDRNRTRHKDSDAA